GRVLEVVPLAAGDKWLITDQTPFYAEAGGQVGDTGTIKADKFELLVKKTWKSPNGVIVHEGDLVRGTSDDVVADAEVTLPGDIGLFKITSEAGIAQGIRRIEAVTAAGALGYLRDVEGELGRAGALLRAAPSEVAARVERLQKEMREREREIEELKRKLALG